MWLRGRGTLSEYEYIVKRIQFDISMYCCDGICCFRSGEGFDKPRRSTRLFLIVAIIDRSSSKTPLASAEQAYRVFYHC